MRYRLFGRTGLYVSELCLGTMTFGGKGSFWEAIGKLSAAEAEAMVGTSLDAGRELHRHGGRLFPGNVQEFLGAALRSLGRPREQVIVATKVHFRIGPGANQVGLSRAHVLAAVEASLRRLKLDFIDLYQIHGADLDTPIEETVRALDDLVRCGKVRYVGFCNLPAWLAMKALGYADAGAGAVPKRPDVLLAGLPRHRAGDRAPGPRSGVGDPALESAGRRAALGQVRPGQARPGGGAADHVRFPAGGPARVPRACWRPPRGVGRHRR